MKYDSYHELPPRTIIATLTGVVASLFMASLDQTIVSTAMPRVISELHGFEHYAGVVTAYMVASTASVPIVGKLSDFYGRRFFLLVGVIIFVLGSILCGLSHDMTQLVFSRGLQGIGAGFVQAMAFTTIADLFPPARRGKVSGLMGAVFGFSSVLGPAVGGLLTDGPGWRYVFFVNVPLGFLAFIILFFSFPKIQLSRTSKPHIDYLGSLTLVLSVVPLLLALSWGGREYAWTSVTSICLMSFGLVMSVLFLFIEVRAKEPIIPLHLFKNRIVWTCMAAATLVAVAMFGTTLFIPLFIQSVIGTSATKSGAVVMPMTLSLIASSIVSGQLITRRGRYRTLAIMGVSLTCLGLFLLSRMNTDTSYFTVVRNMMIMGIGLGSTMPVFTLAVQNAVEGRHVGAITSTVQFVRSVGGALGAAIFGSVLANRFVPYFHSSIPSDIMAQIPSNLLSRFNNPQLLMQPNSGNTPTGRTLAALGDRGPEIAAAIKAAARSGLAASLHEVFLLSTMLMAVAIVITFRLQDIPLRKSNRTKNSALSET